MSFVRSITSLLSFRRFHVGVYLLSISTLIFTTIYLRPDLGFDLSALSYISATRGDAGRVITIAPDPSPSESRLWGYVDKDLEEDVERDTWVWVANQRRAGYRRPSWGGMTQQGPKAHIRDNLKKEERYITTFTEAGFNNEVMEIANGACLSTSHLINKPTPGSTAHDPVIAVAIRSKRIPILPPFLPDYNHLIHDAAAYLTASEVFDFTDLIAKHNVPIIESLELKVGFEDSVPISNRHRSVMYDGEHRQGKLRRGDMIQAETPELDHIACWNTHTAIADGRGGYIGTLSPAKFEDIPLPRSAYANLPSFWHTAISLARTSEAIAAYSKAGDSLPEDSISRMTELGYQPVVMRPDDPLGCIHHVYHLHTRPEDSDVHDDWRRGDGVWDEVGKYMKFQPGLVVMAEDLLRYSFDLKVGEEIPPYMAVHIRRTDFGKHWNATQRQWAHQAWTFLRDTQQKEDQGVRHIVFATDEQDEEWLQELKDLGWVHIDHKAAHTGDRLGWWFPTILDSIILSSAKVFLGVPSSTMSILPYRRVLDWHGGAGQWVQWPDSYSVPPEWEWSDPWQAGLDGEAT